MIFAFNVYSSLLLVFVIHIIVFSILFLNRGIQRGQRSCKWMSAFLLLAALYVAPWMLGFAGWYDAPGYKQILLYFPCQQLLLIGPIIYCYVRSQLNPVFTLKRAEFIHFIPAGAYLLFVAGIFVHDFWINPGDIILSNGLDPDFDDWYQYAGFISLMFYCFLSLRYYRRYRQVVMAVLSDAYDFTFSWIAHFLLVVSAMPVVWLVSNIYNSFFVSSYQSNWWYFLIFALAAYYISIAAYASAVESKIFFTTSIMNTDATVQFYINRPSAYLKGPQELRLPYKATSSDSELVQDKTLSQWTHIIKELMQTEQLHQDSELTLSKVAARLDVNISLLSRIINLGFNKNFNDFVNEFRVQDFITKVQSNQHQRETLLSLAFESGFNSKSTFNRVFKKFMGITPQDYIRQKAPSN